MFARLAPLRMDAAMRAYLTGSEVEQAAAALRFKLAGALGFITEPSDDDLVRMATQYRDWSDDGEDKFAAQQVIVQAATALVEHEDWKLINHGVSIEALEDFLAERDDLIDALAAAVRGETT